MSQRTELFTCECGKQFNNRNELDKHRESCASAQTASAKSGQTRGAGSGAGTTNE
jgi:hypothetical protein